MIEDIDFDNNYEQDFEMLINISVKIGNALVNQPVLNDNLLYSEGLGKKLLFHTLSANELLKGVQWETEEFTLEKFIDLSSIAILSRAALETYLTFNSVFVFSKDEKELEFRFKCWHLGGFLDRADAPASNPEHLAKKRFEINEIIRIKSELLTNEIFQNLNLKDKESVLKGKWKIKRSWKDLAVDSGFNSNFFKTHYGFLCSHAHSSRLSVMQVQQSSFFAQKEMSKSAIMILMVTLGKYIFDYCELHPVLKDFAIENNYFPMISTWKNIGEILHYGS